MKRRREDTERPAKRAGKIRLLDIGISCMTEGQLMEEVLAGTEEPGQASLIFLNTDVMMKADSDAYLKQVIRKAKWVVADGMPLIWISKLYGTPLPEKISGSDFVPKLCEECVRRGKSLYFAGGAPGVAKRAAARLRKRYPGIRIKGCYSPPYGFEKRPEEVEKMNRAIREARPDILIVCLGCPKQETYIFENQDRYQVPVSICAGATIDFLAGRVKRCPPWMSRCGLEWFYRFLQEPGRLFRRYFIDDIQILRLIIRYRPGRRGR